MLYLLTSTDTEDIYSTVKPEFLALKNFSSNHCQRAFATSIFASV